MSFLLAAIVVFGFSNTVSGDFDPPGLPLMIQLHGMLFAAWVLLFIARPIRVATGSLALHRQAGWLGTALTCAMVGMGGYAILFAPRNDALPPFYQPGLFLSRGFIALGVCAGLVSAAVAMRAKPDWHKPLMLCASIIVIVPALERSLPVPMLGDARPCFVDGAVDLVAMIGPGVDLIVRRRVHRADYWGGGALVLDQVSVDLIAPSPVASVMLVGAG